MEIAREAGLDKSTASRLLKTLQDSQFVDRDEKSRAFSVGAGFLALSASAMKQSRLLRLANPYLLRISKTTGESVGLYLRVGMGRVCADGMEGDYSSVPFFPKGEPISLLTGASSLVMLAHLPAEFKRSLYEDEGLRDTEIDAVERELEAIRQKGYSKGAIRDSVTTLSAPFSQNGQVIGAITILGQAERLTTDVMLEHVPMLLEACGDLSLALSGNDYEHIVPRGPALDFSELG